MLCSSYIHSNPLLSIEYLLAQPSSCLVIYHPAVVEVYCGVFFGYVIFRKKNHNEEVNKHLKCYVEYIYFSRYCIAVNPVWGQR